MTREKPTGMKKLLGQIQELANTGGKQVSDKINTLLKEGTELVSDNIGRLPFLASNEQTYSSVEQQYDEKHYFLIPYRLSDVDYTFYSMRVLPDGVAPINDLPKKRIFHFPNEHSESLVEEILLRQLRQNYAEVERPSSTTLGDRLIEVADEIDKVDGKITKGMLLIGGLVALVNPIVGAGFAATSLIPGLGASLSKFGLKNLGQKWNDKQLADELLQAEKKVLGEFKGANTDYIVNPILRELEIALNTDESQHDPSKSFDFRCFHFDSEDNARLTNLTFRVITNTYHDLLDDEKLHAQAHLGPEDIRWLRAVAKTVENSDKRQQSHQWQKVKNRIWSLKQRYQNTDQLKRIDELEKTLETVLSLLDLDSSTTNIMQQLDLHHILYKHLPDTIDFYLRLPPEKAKNEVLRNGYTAEQSFFMQLDILEQTIQRIQRSYFENNNPDLMVHGRFLRDKFYIENWVEN
jgi:hypothetical protein